MRSEKKDVTLWNDYYYMYTCSITQYTVHVYVHRTDVLLVYS